MKKDDLESTMPIKTLKDIEKNTRSSKYLEDDIEEEITRVSKRKDKEIEEAKKQLEEDAEEALAEKNIQEAERLLSEEESSDEIEEFKEDDSSKEEEKDSKKENIFIKLKNKYNSLSKKGKIIFFSILGVILVIIIVLIILLTGKKEPEKVVKPKEEVPIVIVDNYYYKDGSLYLLDKNEKEIGSYECKNKDEQLCYVAFNDVRDSFDIDRMINSKGEDIEQRIPIIGDKYVFITDKEKEKDSNINLYDIENENVLASYNNVKYYSSKLYVFSDNKDKYGLGEITNTGKVDLIKPTYLYLGMIEGKNNLVAKTDKGNFIISKDNKVLSSAISGDISDYSKDLIVSKINDIYNLYDFKGNLIESDYDFIKVIDGYAALVNNKKLYIRDVNNNKYNEDAISLKNSNYIKTFVYNDDNSIKETRKSFTLDYSNSYITVTIFDGDSSTYKNVDLGYNKINVKHKYINYLDKKLYFYKDEDKKELIGSYTCNISNFLESVGEDYDSCYVALDSPTEDNLMTKALDVSVSPIMNERFVFIKDGDSIYLYDLNLKKSLGTYSSINTYSSIGSDTTLESGTYKVVLKSKKNGKYGMIEVGNEGATKRLEFIYTKMEKLGDYILALKDNNKWVLITSDNSSVEFANKIVYYNSNKSLFKSNNNEVYNANGKKLISETLKHVDIRDNYFVTINNNNMLNIYKADGTLITKTGKEVLGSEYSGSTPSYLVTYANNVYTISIRDKDVYKEYKYNVITNAYEGEEEPPVVEEEPTE